MQVPLEHSIALIWLIILRRVIMHDVIGWIVPSLPHTRAKDYIKRCTDYIDGWSYQENDLQLSINKSDNLNLNQVLLPAIVQLLAAKDQMEWYYYFILLKK